MAKKGKKQKNAGFNANLDFIKNVRKIIRNASSCLGNGYMVKGLMMFAVCTLYIYTFLYTCSGEWPILVQ